MVWSKSKIIIVIIIIAGASSISTVFAVGGSNIIFKTFDGIASHEVMRITSDQKVGIGTSTPTEKLDVTGNIHLSGKLSCIGCVNSTNLAGGVITVSTQNCPSNKVMTGINSNGTIICQFPPSCPQNSNLQSDGSCITLIRPSFYGHERSTAQSGSTCSNTFLERNDADSNMSVSIDTSAFQSTCYRAFAEWDTRYIPVNATINKISLGFVVTTPFINPRSCDFNSLADQPTITSGQTLWNDIASGISLVPNSTLCTTLGSHSIDLPSPANLDLKSKLSSQWWGMGMKISNETRDSVGHASSFSTNGDPVNRGPLLTINFKP